MAPSAPLPLLNMKALRGVSDVDYDSSSPYPPSSPSISSDSEDSSPPIRISLQASIATIPESQLRAAMLKLASRNPRFNRELMKELTAYDSPPDTPMAKTPRCRRSRTRRNCKNLSVSTQNTRCEHIKATRVTQPSYSDEDCVYHPGQLEEELYEFVSSSPQEMVVRTVTMWSCCDEDEWSPGCASAPSALLLPDTKIPLGEGMGFAYPDALPDSDLEYFPYI